MASIKPRSGSWSRKSRRSIACLPSAVANADFAIPPGDPNYEGHASATFNEPVTVIYLQPHMHTRGKDMEIRFQYPTGEIANHAERAALQLPVADHLL